MADQNGQPKGNDHREWDRYFDSVLAGPRKNPGDGLDRGSRHSNERVTFGQGWKHVVDFSKTHPSTVESLLPVYGPAREAVADLHDGDYAGAAGNALIAATDLTAAGGIRRGLKLGALYAEKQAPRHLKTPPFGYKNVRRWMKDKVKIVETGQDVHHAIIPQRRKWDDRITNHPLNLKPMKPGTHQRIHGTHRTKPQYGTAKQVWYGLPAWSKMSLAGGAGRVGTAADAAYEDKE